MLSTRRYLSQKNLQDKTTTPLLTCFSNQRKEKEKKKEENTKYILLAISVSKIKIYNHHPNS